MAKINSKTSNSQLTTKTKVKLRWKGYATIGVIVGVFGAFMIFHLVGNDTTSKAKVDVTNLNNRSSFSNQIENASTITYAHKKYESDQEKHAFDNHNSYMGSVGSIQPLNPIDQNQVKPVAYSYKDSLKHKQEPKVTKLKPQALPPKAPAPKAESYQLSSAFAEALNDPSKYLGKDKTVKSSGFITVTTLKEQQKITQSYTPETASSQDIIAKIMAGSLYYGILISSVDSDIKSDVVATIESGKYRNAKLLGKFTMDNEWVNGVTIEFNQMIWKGLRTTVHAVAVNNHYSPSLADDVDHHWFMRIGGLVTASFVKGYATPYANSNQPIIVPTGGSSQQQTYYTPPSAKQAAMTGFGEVGKSFEPIFKNLWNRPTTITVDSGHGVGILFLSDAVFKTSKENS